MQLYLDAANAFLDGFVWRVGAVRTRRRTVGLAIEALCPRRGPSRTGQGASPRSSAAASSACNILSGCAQGYIHEG